MQQLTLDLPAMYGDHHVIEVRRILLEIPGIEEVYASSAFHVVEVTYDPTRVDADTITARLGEAGYLDPLEVALETGRPAYQSTDSTVFFRHTTAYQQAGRTVSFAQNVAYQGRPLWSCPGMGPIRTTDEGE